MLVSFVRNSNHPIPTPTSAGSVEWPACVCICFVSCAVRLQFVVVCGFLCFWFDPVGVWFLRVSRDRLEFDGISVGIIVGQFQI